MPNIKPTKLTNKQFDEFNLEINAIIDLYKQEFSQQIPTNWQTYEKTWKNRLKTALQQIQKVIDHAAAAIEIAGKPLGRPPNTSHKQKTLLLFTKDLVQFSGRKMADMLPMFTTLDGVDLCYKTIQRAYSNPVIKMTIHNMFIILVKSKGIKQADLTGDGTGYSLTITKHYRSVREKAGDAAKSNEAPAKAAPKPVTKEEKKKLFTYAFALMDLKSHMYVGYGASLKSERAAFDAAMALMHECNVEPKSVRLDQYYAGQSTAELFGAQTSLYVIPKSNATIRGCYAWKDMIRDFMYYPFLFLKEYFRREHSESGFSADKRFNGWKIWERRDERIQTATMCKGVWHNLIWLGG
ncbi:ISNCY family transposase [Candidatus Bathyarchaeota archaeon]|nr:ISNCY family transposase [Candidatus Bathyarchaeota archaeon]